MELQELYENLMRDASDIGLEKGSPRSPQRNRLDSAETFGHEKIGWISRRERTDRVGGLGLQWRRLAISALHASVEIAVSTRTVLVWRRWNREDHAHGHVLRAVVSFPLLLCFWTQNQSPLQ